uniref:Uncharacterized protein n=1 Tax=Noctiluca scintillans TaxID=2966 RepID=A0A7S1FIG2_NOCSC
MAGCFGCCSNRMDCGDDAMLMKKLSEAFERLLADHASELAPLLTVEAEEPKIRYILACRSAYVAKSKSRRKVVVASWASLDQLDRWMLETFAYSETDEERLKSLFKFVGHTDHSCCASSCGVSVASLHSSSTSISSTLGTPAMTEWMQLT